MIYAFWKNVSKTSSKGLAPSECQVIKEIVIDLIFLKVWWKGKKKSKKLTPMTLNCSNNPEKKNLIPVAPWVNFNPNMDK